jgi:DNA-binding phage protein
MDCNTLICETDKMAAKLSPEYIAAARAFLRAQEVLEAKREALAAAIADEARRGAKLSHIAREAGYTPQHVARIARAHGVEPAVNRTPPPTRPPAAS